jgi:hypothetical protein
MKQLIITLGLLLSSHLYGQEFTAYVSKSEVPLGEVFQVTFELKEGRGGQVSYPNFDGFQVRGGPSFQQSVQMVNGQVNQSLSYSFYLQGTRTGTFNIGAASVEVNGKTLRSEPVSVKITPARSSGSSSAGQASSSDDDPNEGQSRDQDINVQLRDNVFVRALVSDRNVYQGEQFTVSYKLYERVQTFDLRPEGNPSYEGFWVENIDLRNPPPKMEVVDGKQYRTYVIKKDILFAQRPGDLSVDPLQLSCVVRVQAARQRQQRSIFDSFFGQYENYKYTFASAPVRIDVKPLPAGRPAKFSGVVGDLDLDVTLDTTSVETGNPLTFKVVLSGRGNIKKLQAPNLQLPPDFEVYDPTVTEQISRDNGVLSGRRSFEYLIIPRNPGTYQLPPIQYSFFDPSTGRYRTLASPAYEIVVTGEPQQSSSAVPSASGGTNDLALLGQDIRFIHPSPGDLQPLGSSFLLSWTFALLYLLPILAMVGLWIVKRQQRQDRRDVAGVRRRKAAKMAKKRLSAAKKHLQANEEKAFYDEVVRALWDYLGNKFNLGQSELSRDSTAALLQAQGADQALVSRLHQLLDTCDMALFAPNAAPGGMAGTYDQTIELIADLEDVRMSAHPHPQV